MATSSHTETGNVISLEQQAEQTLRSKTLLQRAMYRLRHDYVTLTAIGTLIILAALCFAAPLVVDITGIDYNKQDLYNNELPPLSQVSDSDSTTLMWLTSEGTFRRPFIAHTQNVTSVVFNSAGDHFLTGSEDGDVRYWHVPTQRNKRRLTEIHDGIITSVAFTSTGEQFFTAGEDGLVQLWDAEKPDPNAEDIPIQTFDHPEAVNSVAVSSDDTFVLTGSADGIVRLWDSQEGGVVRQFEGHEGNISQVNFNADGSLLVSAGDDNATVWETNTGNILFVLNDHDGAVLSATFDPTGANIVTGGADSTVRLWSVQTGELLSTYEGHTDAVNTVSFSADGSQIVSGSEDAVTILWDTESGEIIHQLDDEEYQFPVSSAAMSPDGEFVLTGTEGHRRFYLLGTDGVGRDHLTRLLYGGQVSLIIGFAAAIGALTIGVIIGVTTGFFGGLVDDAIIWFITTLDSIPFILLLLIISAMLTPNAQSIILIFVFLGWTGATRIVRGETFSLREREFVLAARALGASNGRIMFLHIAPNVISILLIVMTRSIGNLILAESSLSFLGVGVQPPTATWGNMLSGGLTLLREAPHLVFAPGLLIWITVLCLFIIGDGLRDAFDPKIAD